MDVRWRRRAQCLHIFIYALTHSLTHTHQDRHAKNTQMEIENLQLRNMHICTQFLKCTLIPCIQTHSQRKITQRLGLSQRLKLSERHTNTQGLRQTDRKVSIQAYKHAYIHLLPAQSAVVNELGSISAGCLL